MRGTGYTYHYLDARLDIERPNSVLVEAWDGELRVFVNEKPCLIVEYSRTPIVVREYD